jgi:hypothetical protein
LALFVLVFSLTVSTVVFADTSAESVKDPANWIIPEGYEGRVSVTATDDGLVIDQLVQGTPSNHAVAIAVPFNGTESYEVTLRIDSEEYVASGRLANDVWTGIGFMGKPTFINWRNNAESGLAKDSPGLFTRFFNYAGELRLITDVYQENYYTGTEYVDTWTLLDASANASAEKDVTIKLAYEQDGDATFYNLYVNGKKISSGAELLNVDPEATFPEGKIYLMVAMNTQAKETNKNTRVTIKSINGVSFVKEKTETPSDGGEKKKGCGGSIATTGVIALAILALGGVALNKKSK